MARGVNKVILVGNCGQDPETRFMPSGGAVTNLSIATSESWKDKTSGEPQERTEWHRVVFFNRLAEIAGEYVKKGSKLYVEGQLTHRSYEDNTGQKKYVTEVKLSGFNSALQLLDTKGEAKGEMEIGNLGEPKPSQQPIEPVANDGFEDDIPF